MTRARIAAVLLAAILAAIMPWLAPIRTLEDLSVNARFAIRGPIPRSNRVVVAAIDDRTEREWKSIPKAFWAGEIAKLLDKLREMGAARIGLDVLFQGDPDAYLTANGLTQTPISNLDNAIFASHGRVLLGTSAGSLLSPGLEDATDGRELVSLDGLQVGRTAVRQLPTLDKSYAPPRRTLSAGLAESNQTNPITINYTMSAPNVISVADILDGLVGPDAVKGKVILVGETFRDSDDREDTPIALGVPGVLIQAEAADTLLNDRALQTPADLVTSICLGIFALGLGALAVRRPYVSYALVSLGLVAVWSVFAWWSFGAKNWIVPVVAPALTGLIIVPGVVLPVLAAQNRAQLAWTRAQWGQMMPDGFVDRLEARRKSGLGPWGEFNAVVLFADLEGFSDRTNHCSPSDLVTQLNSVFECLVEPIQEHGGVVLNFLGDGLCAMFEIDTADASGEAARRRSLAAVVEARSRVKGLDDAGGWGVRFGLASGAVTLALVGSKNRRQMTIYGSAVNLAARLEQAVKSERARLDCEACWFLAAADFGSACDHFGLDSKLTELTPKGWSEPVSARLGYK